MELGPCGSRPPLGGQALMGFLGSDRPLSARAQTPLRPSGDAKEQEPAENEGSAGPGRTGPPGDRAEIAARRHHLPSSWSPKVADQGKFRVNRHMGPRVF